jgi:MFS transporter, ACS family, aldohexuronate transporter
VRLGYGLSVTLWSIACMAHGLVRSVLGFSVMRAALGLAEGGNFPAAVKSVSEWFPKSERAFATGIFNAGSNIGMVIAPILVPWLTLRWGWPSTFYVTGGLGLIWLVCWWLAYDAPERHPRVSPAELAHIQSDPVEPSVHIPWLTLLKYRQVWAYVVAQGLTSPIWWFYLFWAAGFFHDKFGVDLKNIGWPLVTIYLLADFGSIGGGWLSSALIKRGWTVNASRKTAMLVCALSVVPVFYASITKSPWVATFLIGVAASAHQGYSCNAYTLVSDMCPRNVISSIVGIGGMAAGLIAMGFQQMTGRILDHYENGYVVILAIASVAYLINLAIIQVLVPRMEPMHVSLPDQD